MLVDRAFNKAAAGPLYDTLYIDSDGWDADADRPLDHIHALELHRIGRSKYAGLVKHLVFHPGKLGRANVFCNACFMTVPMQEIATPVRSYQADDMPMRLRTFSRVGKAFKNGELTFFRGPERMSGIETVTIRQPLVWGGTLHIMQELVLTLGAWVNELRRCPRRLSEFGFFQWRSRQIWADLFGVFTEPGSNVLLRKMVAHGKPEKYAWRVSRRFEFHGSGDMNEIWWDPPTKFLECLGENIYNDNQMHLYRSEDWTGVLDDLSSRILRDLRKLELRNLITSAAELQRLLTKSRPSMDVRLERVRLSSGRWRDIFQAATPKLSESLEDHKFVVLESGYVQQEQQDVELHVVRCCPTGPHSTLRTGFQEDVEAFRSFLKDAERTWQATRDI